MYDPPLFGIFPLIVGSLIVTLLATLDCCSTRSIGLPFIFLNGAAAHQDYL